MSGILQGKIAFVTGGSRGIGCGIVKMYLREGASVYYFSRNKSSEHTSMELLAKEHGGVLTYIAGEVTKEEDIQGAIQQAKQKSGNLDILVNNAGITRDKLFIGMKKEDWDEVMDVNLRGVFFACKTAVPIMLKQKSGAIINMSSIVGITGNPGQANYCASKAGLIGFTKSLALEIAKKNVRVNAIAPGFISSDMTDNIPEEYKQKIIEQIPMKRVGTPEDIANTCVFLGSDNASYITGQVISISGGLGG